MDWLDHPGAEPETYHFDGSYFYDKSTGSGGVHIANFRIGGQPADASPFVPPSYKPYFGQGGGGSLLQGNVPADPRCAERVDSARERTRVYYRRLPDGKIFHKRVAPIRLRSLRQRLLERNGPPHRRAHHTDRFDVEGGGELAIAYRGNALDRRVAALLTTSPGHRRGRISPGAAARRARKALKAGFAFRVAGDRVLEAPRRRRSRLLLGVDAGKVAWIAVIDPRRVGDRALRKTLRNLLAS